MNKCHTLDINEIRLICCLFEHTFQSLYSTQLHRNQLNTDYIFRNTNTHQVQVRISITLTPIMEDNNMIIKEQLVRAICILFHRIISRKIALKLDMHSN